MDFLKGIGDFFSGWFGGKKRKRIQEEAQAVGEQAYQHAKQATPEQAQPQSPAPQERPKLDDLSEFALQAERIARSQAESARFNKMRRGGMGHMEATRKIQAEKDAINQQIRQKQAEERQKHEQEVKQPMLNEIEKTRQAINSAPNISQRQKDAINQRANELKKKIGYVANLNNVEYKDWWTKDYERFANLNQRINEAYSLGKSIFDKTGDANKARQAIDQQLAHSDEMTRLEDEEKGYRDTAGAIALATQIPRNVTKTVTRYGAELTTSGLEAIGNMTNNQALANAARQGQQALDEAVFNKLDTEYDNRLIRGLASGVTGLGMDIVFSKAVVGALGKAGALNKVVKGADKANQFLSKQGKLSSLVGKGIQAGLGSPEAIASTATALFRHYPQNYNEVYNDARAKGVDHHQANTLAHSNAVFNAVIEKTNLDLSGWFKAPGMAPNRGFQAIKRAVGEGAEEWMQTMSTYAIKSVYGNIDWNKAMSEANESGLMGVAVGGIADQINTHLPKVLHKIDQEVDHKISPAAQPITNALVKVELKKQITKAVQPDNQILIEAMRLNDEAVKFKLASDEHGRYVEIERNAESQQQFNDLSRNELAKRARNVLNDQRTDNPFSINQGELKGVLSGQGNKEYTRSSVPLSPAEFEAKMRLAPEIRDSLDVAEYYDSDANKKGNNLAPDGFDYYDSRFKDNGRNFINRYNIAKNNKLDTNTIYGATTFPADEKVNPVEYNDLHEAEYQPDQASGSVLDRRQRFDATATEVDGQVQASERAWRDNRGTEVGTNDEVAREKIAQLLKDYRNPDRELTHFFYVKDGVIVGHNVTTLNDPISSSVGAKEAMWGINNRMERLGADKFYLAHNHPSGNLSASSGDRHVTQIIQKQLGDKFGGHIITDHDGILTSKDGYFDKTNIDLGEQYVKDGVQITTEDKALELAKEHFDPKVNHDKIGLFILDVLYRPIGYEKFRPRMKDGKVDIEATNNTIKQMAAKHNGIVTLVAAGDDFKHIDNRTGIQGIIGDQLMLPTDSGDFRSLNNFEGGDTKSQSARLRKYLARNGKNSFLHDGASDIKQVSDFYYNDHQSAAQLRQSLIDQLWQANKKGQGVDHIWHEAENALDDTYMVRASNNSPFYSGYFEANGKKPTKAGITAIVDEMLGIENDHPTPIMTHQMWDAIAYEYGDPEGIADAYKRLEQKQQSRQEKEKQMLENIIAESNSIKQELSQDPTPIKQVIDQKQDEFKNVPLENKNHAYTKGNLYQQTAIGSAEDVVHGGGAENGRRFIFGNWEMRQHTRKKNGKSFTQVERRYIDPETGEAGDWKPYSRAAYLWHTQSDKIDQANRDQLIQQALEAAKQDGEVREFVAATDEKTGGTKVQPLTGNKTIDGGLVRDPISGEVEGNYIQVTPFGVVNQVAGKLHLTELDQIIAKNSDKKAKPGIFDTYMRTVEKTAANEQSKQTQQDLYYKKTMAYAEFIKNKEEVLAGHTEQAGILEGYRPKGVKAKAFWEDVGRYTENTFPAIEGKNQQEAFAKKYGNEAAQAVEKYSQYMRQQYDSLINQANAVRRMYGKDEIPHRKNYMPHMTKDGGLLGMMPAEIAANLRGEMETVGRGEIPANIAGLSETFKPNKKYNQHEMRRKRQDTSDYELDPRKVFEKYTDLVLYNAHMEPVIAEGRQLETAMRVADHDLAKEVLDPLSALKQSEAKVSSRQTIAIMDFVNAMAGKSNALDRAFIDRTANQMRILRKLENINGANKIMGNISSTFAQALNLPSTVRENGLINTTKALLFGARKPEVKIAMKRSPFLTERYGDGGDKFSKTNWQKISGGVSKVSGMDAVESAFIRLAWGANYQRFKSEGYKGFELIKRADQATERAVGGRGIGAMPQAYQSALGKIFLQFTYETNETFKNDIEHIAGIVSGIKSGEYGKSAKMALHGAEAMVLVMLMNFLWKMSTGNEPLPDPATATIKSIGNLIKSDDDKTKDKDIIKNIVGNVGTEFIKSNPVASAAINMLPKSDRQQIFGSDSDFGRFDGATGVAQTAASGLKGVMNLASGEHDKAVQNLTQIIPMGSQIRKTVGGADALLKGAVTKKDKQGNDKVVYKVDNKNPFNIAKGLLFGKNALNETQAHYQAKSSQVSKSSAAETNQQSQNKLLKQQMGDDYKIYKMNQADRKKAVIEGKISKQRFDEVDQKAQSIKQKLGMEVKELDKYQAAVNKLKLERDYLDKTGYEQAEDRASLNQQLELAEFKLKLSKNESDRPILEAYDRMSAQGFKRFTKNDLRRFAQRQANPQEFWGKLLNLDQQQYQITGKYKLHNKDGEADTIEQAARGRGRRKSGKINFNSGVDFSAISTKARSIGQSIKSPARGAVSYQISNNAFTYQPMPIRRSTPRLPKYKR